MDSTERLVGFKNGTGQEIFNGVNKAYYQEKVLREQEQALW